MEIEQLKSGNWDRREKVRTNKETNDHITLKWLSEAVNEVKTEISEIQTTLNSTVVLQNHESVLNEMHLLKTDVSNLNKELVRSKQENVKYEAEMSTLREEMSSLSGNWRKTAAMCGRVKNQVSCSLNVFYFIFLEGKTFLLCLNYE